MNLNTQPNLMTALRGPVLMMTLGTILALDHFTIYSFGQTWPALLIVFGLMVRCSTTSCGRPLRPIRAGERGSSAMNPPNPNPFLGRPFSPRRSLIGPVILILIGCVFLISNMKPDLPVWRDTPAHYWPFLLAHRLGAIRAMEVLVVHFGSPVAALRHFGWRVDAGDFPFDLRLHSVCRPSLRRAFPDANITRRGLQIFGEGFDYPVEAKIQAGATPKLIIDDFSGDARIVAGDGTFISQVPEDLLHGHAGSFNHVSSTENDAIGADMPSPLLCYAGYPAGPHLPPSARPRYDFWGGPVGSLDISHQDMATPYGAEARYFGILTRPNTVIRRAQKSFVSP